MADDDEELDVTEEGPARHNKKGLLIAIAVVVFLVAAGGGALFFLLDGEIDTSEQAPVTRSAGPVQYVDLAPAFIVNFPHQGRQRFLQATLTVMGRDAAAMQAVLQHMPVIRHNLINLLSAQLILVFEDPAGIEQLRVLATEEVKQILVREIGREGIEEVLFTSFVMQ
jgi:flagellar protein FliL